MLTRLFWGGLLFLICLTGYKLYDAGGLYRSAREVPEQMAIGPEDADLTVVEFFDYQCSHCRNIYPVIREAVRRDGNVRLVLRPVSEPGPKASVDVLLGFAALKQDKYMQMHEALISGDGEPLTQEEIKALAGKLGLDYDRLLADMSSHEVREMVQQNFQAAVDLRVGRVPTFLIGTLVFVPTGRTTAADDFLKLFAEARGDLPS